MEAASCAKCGEQPAGEGGVLCPPCEQTLYARMRNYWTAEGQDHEPTDGDVTTIGQVAGSG